MRERRLTTVESRAGRLQRTVNAFVPLCAVLVLSGVGSWVMLGGKSTPAHGSRTLPAHAVWHRHETLRVLMRDARIVTRGTVVGVTAYPPITWQDAGASEGAPEIPRRLVTFRTDDQYFGQRLGETFAVVQALPPDGALLPEFPTFVVGERAVLFLRGAVGPKGRNEIPGAYDLIGIDGRYRVDETGRVVAFLGGAPVDEVDAAVRNPRRFQEAAP